MSKSRLQAEWEKARDDLGLELVIPFSLDLGEAETIDAELLVKSFGDRNGMLIVKRYGVVKDYREQIAELGFGFSVLDELENPYDRATLIEMLRDWGWTGSAAETPGWILASD